METPKIAVFARCHYDNDIPESNLICFENYFLQSLKNQTYKDFEVIIIVSDNDKNTEILKDILRRSGLRFDICNKNNRIRFQHEIEINLDSDDAVCSQHIERIVELYHKTDIETFLIVFTKYIKVNIETLQKYSCITPTKENRGFPTNFYAVVQKGEKILGCGRTSHNRMDEFIPDIVVVDDLICTVCIHGNNFSTQLTHHDKLIDE